MLWSLKVEKCDYFWEEVSRFESLKENDTQKEWHY